jgi:hypothetical protein
LPAFAVDLAGVIYSQPRLMALPESPEGAFQMRLAAGIGGKYVIERSGDFANWTPLMTVTNLQGASLIMEIPGTTNAAGFYRARQTN